MGAHRATQRHGRNTVASEDVADDITEDEAVASAIEKYKRVTGVELHDAEVRIAVREKMAANAANHGPVNAIPPVAQLS